MADKGRAVSVALQDAQHRLEQLRLFAQTQRPFSDPTPQPTTQALPNHLGWGSARLTAVLRQTSPSSTNSLSDDNWIETVQPKEIVSDTAVSQTQPANKEEIVKLYPSIALGILQKEAAAAGRIWLLLKYLDKNGRGWLENRDVRFSLTNKQSELRVCGWRQLRNLLNQGDGVFWERDRRRIWLKSVARVAEQLEVDRLQYKPVALPVAVLTEKIGVVRAHLYASFHSSRSEAPISRDKLEELSNVRPRIQRRYEKIAKVKKQRNFAVGQQATEQNLEEKAWQQGHATFQLKDFQGKQGRKGKTYLAWQLPNSYSGPHARLAKGQQKRINQELTDLFMQGMTGNDHDSRLQKRFFDNGRIAASVFSKTKQGLYWKGTHNQGCDNRGCQFWHVLEK